MDNKGKTVTEMIQEMKGLIMGIILGNNSGEEDFDSLALINGLMLSIKDSFRSLETDLNYYKGRYIRTKVKLDNIKKD